MPKHLTPAQRSASARLAALTLHSQVDGVEHTTPARAKFLQGFIDQVDPDRVLPEGERLRRADCALRAHMTRLAFLASKARSARAAESAEGGGAA